MLIPITLSAQQVTHDDDVNINEILTTYKDHYNNNNQLNGMDLTVQYKSSTVENNRNNSDFIPVFDGKTLDGWKMAGDGSFVIVEKDEALHSEKGGGLLGYTEKKYDSFELKLEWKVTDEDDDSRIFVRFPDPADDPRIAVTEGYEIQIDDKAGDAIRQTGTIYEFAAPSKIVSKTAGQWNTMKVQVINQSYSVIIKGEEVTKFTGNRLTEGYIGLQAHDNDSKVSFKNIKIKEVK